MRNIEQHNYKYILENQNNLYYFYIVLYLTILCYFMF